jgi:hypothetical protein
MIKYLELYNHMDSFYYFDDTPIKVMIKREHEQENNKSP